jgi:hypothetical protein
MSATETNTTTSSAAAGARSGLFNALMGLTTLAILLQGLWAGIFLEHDGKRDDASGWIDTHAVGAYVALVLALAATIVAFMRLRSRKDLVRGTAALTVLIFIEGPRPRRGGGTDALTAVHIPLAMALMAMAVGLSIRARH